MHWISLAGLLVGCADRAAGVEPVDLVGSWESEETSLDRASTLEIRADLTGEVWIAVVVEGYDGVSYFVFDVISIDTGDDAMVTVELDDEFGQGFSMPCELVTRESLDCTLNGIFGGTPVTWMRLDD